MRSEVMMLSRNIVIQGTDEDTWGCQILMSNTMDMQGNIYKGRMMMENAEVRHCSQRGTGRSALRFDQGTGESVVSGCSVHSGLGHGVSLKNHENV
jgi:hypothetical protein